MRLWLCVGILIASTVSAYATVDVPEIDAFSGLSALGVIGSIGALIWERRRNRRRADLKRIRKELDLSVYGFGRT
jgi:hypothetical protein